MKKLMTIWAAMAIAAPAIAAGQAAWDGAMKKTIWEIVHGDPGTAPGAPAPVPAGVNRHVACYATQFFGALQVEFEQVPDGVRVRLQGHHAREAARSLNLPGADAADAFEVTFEKDSCQVSTAHLGVLSCSLQDWKWPRPVLAVRVLDRDGKLISSTGKLSVVRMSLEATERTSAGGASGDTVRPFLELDASFISETENDKRAELRLPYQPQDCREK